MRIAVTGGTGLIGTRLREILAADNHHVATVPRTGTGLAWLPEKGIPEPAAWEGLDAVVHLAGAPMDQRWTKARRQKMWDSRVPATTRLCEDLAALDQPPRVLVSASAVGYYGDHPEPVDEAGGTGEGFLAEVVEGWEDAAQPARDAGMRVVHPRTGIVLSAKGGALKRMLLPAKLGAAGPISGGQQRFPWIHIDDEARGIRHLLEHDLSGPVNMVSPGIVRQKEFIQALGRVLKRPAFAPLPAPAIQLMFGQMGKEFLVWGQNAQPRVLEASGFRFEHTEVEEALRSVLARQSHK